MHENMQNIVLKINILDTNINLQANIAVLLI